MVRALGGKLADQFESQGLVAIGFGLAEDLTATTDRDAFFAVMRRAMPSKSDAGVVVGGGSSWRFIRELQTDDDVITYDTAAREYLVGKILGPCEFSSKAPVRDMHHFRRVRWLGRVERNSLTERTRLALGSTITVFRVRDTAASEIIGIIRGQPSLAATGASAGPDKEPETIDETETMTVARDEVVERARDLVTERVDRISWDSMQELVAGILRAMSYKTRVSPRGADRGRDIVASPDGLGLEQPRIVVEVKHREGAIGAPEIRSFIGGLRSTDRGLYVSTGGFKKEARYEADRANPPVTLLDLDELVSLLIEHYDAADAKTKALVPLVPIYWPAS